MKNEMKEFLQLIDEREWTNVEQKVCSKQDQTLKIIIKGLYSKDGTLLLNGILKSLQCRNNESILLKTKIYEKVLNVMKNNEEVDEKGNAKLATVLNMHIDTLPNSQLMNIINLYLEQLKAGLPFYGRWTDVFGSAVSVGISRGDLVVEGEAMPSDDFRYFIIKTICEAKWSARTAATILPLITELCVPKEEVEVVIEKVGEVLHELDYPSVPPIAYQALLLSQDRCSALMIHTLLRFFNGEEEKVRKTKNQDSNNGLDSIGDSIEENSFGELVEAQGTVILHLSQLAQSNPQLMKELLKILRCKDLPENIFTPFNVALALSLARENPFKDQVLDSIKSCIIHHLEEEEKGKRFLWLCEAFPTTFNLLQVFRTTVDNCKSGWDQVSESMVTLCFRMVESSGGFFSETYSRRHSVSLVCAILPLVFKKEPRLAPHIFNHLSILVRTNSSASHCVDVLGRLVKASPVLMLDEVPLVRELLEQLPFLSPALGSGLLTALQPLLKMSVALKDALLLILRKMLFSREVEKRKTAVRGFLQILRHFRILGTFPASQGSMSFSSSLSQVSADVHSAVNSGTNEALCLDLLGVLRRVFTQQSEVRSTLYADLCDVVQANWQLGPSVLRLLHQHLSSFVDTSQHVLNPLLLAKAVSVRGEEVTLVEPLGELLSCLARCKAAYQQHRDRREEMGQVDDEDEDAVVVLNEVCSTFDILTEKLAYADMDDLDFGSASFSSATVPGRRNQISAQIMVEALEALMDQSVESGAFETEQKMKTLIALFKTQRAIVAVVKESFKPAKKSKNDGPKGKSAGAAAAPSFKSVLSLEVAVKMLKVSLGGEEGTASNPRCASLVEGNFDLEVYLVSVISQAVGSLKELSPSRRERLLVQLKAAGYLLLKELRRVTSLEIDPDDDRLVSRTKQLLLTFHALINAFFKHYNEKLPQIFKELTGKSPSKDYEHLLYCVTKYCLNFVLKVLQSEGDDSPFLKEAALLVQVVGLLTEQMTPSCRELSETLDTVNQICKDQAVECPPLADALVHLLLALMDRVHTSSNLVRSLGRVIHHRMKDLEQDVVLEETGEYQVVTEASAAAVLTTVCTYCEDVFSALELVLGKLRARLASMEKSSDADVDRVVGLKLAVIIHALHEIFQSAIPLKATQYQVLKTAAKFYGCITAYVKYQLDYFRLKTNPQMSEKFEKVINLCNKMLKDNTFRMINYTQNVQQTQAGTKKSSASAGRVQRESKLIPDLVYAMEQYENHLVRLTRRSKVDLLAGTKRTTSRDFRIIANAIKEVETKTGSDTDDDREEEEKDEGEGEGEKSSLSPPKKKKKTA